MRGLIRPLFRISIYPHLGLATKPLLDCFVLVHANPNPVPGNLSRIGSRAWPVVRNLL
jgi:hypothetical protein